MVFRNSGFQLDRFVDLAMIFITAQFLRRLIAVKVFLSLQMSD